MLFSKKQFFILSLTFFMICIFTVYLQSNLLLNGDTGYFIYAAEKFLKGGSYTEDFFEPNAPLIIYLSILPALLIKYFHLSIVSASQLFTFFLAFFSLTLNYYLIQKIFAKNESLLALIFLAALAFVFFVLPLQEFGQREHLLVLLSTPYLLLVVVRSEAKKINPLIAIFIGLLSGIGCCLKPFFMLLPFFIEICFTLFTKKYKFIFRLEIGFFLLTLFIYLATVFFLNDDYLTIISPYVLRLYYVGLTLPIKTVISQTELLFCFLVIAFYFSTYPYHKHKALGQVLGIALITYSIIYVIGGITWYYHLIPAFSFAILTSLYLFITAMTTKEVHFTHDVLTFFLILISFFFVKTSHASMLLLTFPQLFYVFFSMLIGIILTKYYKNLFKVLAFLAMILAITWYFTSLFNTDNWYFYQFDLSLLMLTFLLLVFTPSPHKKQGLWLFTVGIALFLYPSFYLFYTYNTSRNNESSKQFISFVQTHFQGKKIYFFSARMGVFFYQEKLNLVSRFHHFWMLPGIVRKTLDREKEDPQLDEDTRFFFKLLLQDFKFKRPQIVFVDTPDFILHYKDKRINYLYYLLENPEFRKEWKNYTYQSSFHYNESETFNIDIYQRTSL